MTFAPIALAPLLTLPPPSALPPAGAAAPIIHETHTLGTSLDMMVTTDDALLAAHVRHVVLDALAMAERELDTRSPHATAARFARGEAIEPGPLLRRALALYSTWETRTGGAVSAHTGALSRLWADAARTGRTPTEDEILAARTAGRPGLNLDALGKPLALEVAADAVTKTFPGLPGFLLNLGGDIVCRGVGPAGLPWTVEIAGPGDPAYNAPAVDTVRINNGAVVTSGDAHRHHDFGGLRHSHLLNPGTGRSATGFRGATVVADDAVTANALACAICVLGEPEGIALVDATPRAAARAQHRDGTVATSARWPELRVEAKSPPAEKKTDAPIQPAWPDHMRFLIDIKILKTGKKNPYVAVWISDKDGKLVRNLVIWGGKTKYYKSLKSWWKDAAQGDASRAAAVSRATNKPGEYTLEWDGKDDAGQTVPPGDYTVHIESSQEDVGRAESSVKISCKGSTAAKATLDGCGKTLDKSTVTFAKK